MMTWFDFENCERRFVKKYFVGNFRQNNSQTVIVRCVKFVMYGKSYCLLLWFHYLVKFYFSMLLYHDEKHCLALRKKNSYL